MLRKTTGTARDFSMALLEARPCPHEVVRSGPARPRSGRGGWGEAPAKPGARPRRNQTSAKFSRSHREFSQALRSRTSGSRFVSVARHSTPPGRRASLRPVVGREHPVARSLVSAGARCTISVVLTRSAGARRTTLVAERLLPLVRGAPPAISVCYRWCTAHHLGHALAGARRTTCEQFLSEPQPG
jgi:hypothetical protein